MQSPLRNLRVWLLISLLILPSFPVFSAVSADNVIQNESFEQAIGGSGNWDNTTNRGISLQSGGVNGSQFLRLDEATTVGGGFAGVFTFQTVSNINENQLVTFGGFVRANSLDVGDAAQLRIEFQTAAGTTFDDQIVAVSTTSTSFQYVSTSKIAPGGTRQVTFTIRIQPSAAAGGSQVDFDGMQASAGGSPIFLDPQVGGSTASPGQQLMIAARIQNKTATTLTNVEVVADASEGIRIVENQGALQGQRVNHRQGSVIYTLGSIPVGFDSVLAFPVILSAVAIPGKSYEVTLQARNPTQALSPVARVLIIAEADPIFQQGTIIGKVFNDLNQNTVQDPGEKGVPAVRIVTEEGVVILTDDDGKYNVPAVNPGRHVVKIDGHTLPQGTRFISEPSRIIRTTEGILNKVNFAVLLPPSKIPDEFKKDLDVIITQGLDFSKPNLEVAMEPTLLKAGLGVLEIEPVFQFKINYPEFVQRWYLEVRDELGREVWTGFGASTPPSEVVWSGQTEDGVLVHPGIYSYQLKVEDKDGRQDWTPLSFFRVVSKTASLEEQDLRVEIPTVGDFNIFQDGKQTIPLVAKPTLSVRGKTHPGNTITINQYPAEVDPSTGAFRAEVYTSPGEKEVLVTATTPDGETISYRESVTVKDSMFFMVALAEEELGMNFTDGNLETVRQDESYKDGFYEDGRLSYYLKGKLKGKFLVRSHYDTSDRRTVLFKNLDPEDYYPVYGDSSVRDYEADGSLDRFFMVVEMDRSFAKWGSFHTEFNDTELATYNRTLNGLNVHYESAATTPYGDPKKGMKLFWTQARHRADHNEFAGTGGTLYYLRNRRVIDGSEKIRVEVRDKIQDMSVSSYDLKEGTDYEIDYDEGRILLTRPLSSIAASDSIISTDILDGDSVYLIVDYEYDAGQDIAENANRGLRGYTHMGDHVKIGATAVEERRDNQDYDLRGVDATFKVGRNTKIQAEYAETQLEQVDQAVSYNGGLSFADLPTIHGAHTRPRENAYLVKGESKPIKNLEVGAYVQGVEPGFSTDRIRSQEGTKKFGTSIKYKIHEYAYIRHRWDHTEISDQLLPLQNNNVAAPFENIQTHIAQAVFDNNKWLGQLEYKNQDVELPRSNLTPTILSESPFEQGLGAKLGYRINEKIMPYLRAQTTFSGKPNRQFGGGMRYDLTRSVAAYFEQMFGNLGDATIFGFEKTQENGMTSYANIRKADPGIGTKTLSTAIGSTVPLSEKSRFFSEREHSTFQGEEGYADIMGITGRRGESWDYEVRFERRHLDNGLSRLLDVQAENSLARANTFNTLYGSAAYKDGKKLKMRISLEGRRDQDTPKLFQVAARHFVEYQINPDLSFGTNLNYGVSRFLDPDDRPADFVEFNTGFAYRPIENDKLNFLTRYTYLRDLANDIQFQNALFSGIETDETAHILALDLAYDLHRYVGIVEKLAYKYSILETNVTENSTLNSFLWAHRFNFHVTSKWDLALEYRVLWQTDVLDALQHGALVEVDRTFYDYVKLGVGYDFTDFDDDLRRSSSFKSQGPFVRLTGKF